MSPSGPAWQLLARAAEGHGGRNPYLCTLEGVWSFQQVLEEVTRAAAFLLAHGGEVGERVVLAMGDRAEMVVAFWAALWAGMVAVPVAPSFSPRELREILVDSGAGIALGDATSAKALASAAEGLSVRLFFCADKPPWSPTTQTASPAKPEGSEPALMLYTSGTTGRMKGVVHSHRNVLAAAGGLGPQVLSLTPEDRVFSAARMFFAYGLGNSVYIPAACGCAAVVHPGPVLPGVVREILERFRPTVLFVVPSLYRALAPQPGVPWRSLRCAVSAGEKLAPELWQLLTRRAKVPVLDGLGMTETLHHFTSNRPGEVAPGSVGRPLAGFSLKVLDEQGEPVAEGQVGELWVSGPSVMDGYFRQPEKTAAVLKEGWLRTGDLVSVRGGFVYHCGRRDDLVKLSGIAVFLSEVEEVLKKHPGVAEAAVVPVERGAGVATLKAFIVPRPGEPPQANELFRFCRRRLAAFKVPREFEMVESLPYTLTGKLRRFSLAAPR